MSALQTQESFLNLLQRSEIVGADALTEICNRIDLPEEPKPLAKALIKEGVLTHFQADQLLQGRWRNFLFAGKFRVLERVGTGATGQVYLCEHQTMNRLVALKVLPKTYLDNPAVLERFYREGRITATLEHSNIVRAFDNGQTGRHHYLVMEYIYGNNLQRIVEKRGILDLHRATQYIYQAAVGLKHIHKAGLIHRDIKPSNLLLDQHGTVKILDLGLARCCNDPCDNITSRYEPTAILGTADFLSPEQARSSSQVDIRSDIYSLGVTWYFLLAGASPFADVHSVNAKLMMHQLHEPEPIREVQPDVPKEMAAVLDRMLEKDVSDRFQDPGEVVEALEQWTDVPVLPPEPDEMPNVCLAIQRRLFPDQTNSSQVKTPRRPKVTLRSSQPCPVMQDTIPTQMDTARSPACRPSPQPKEESKPQSEKQQVNSRSQPQPASNPRASFSKQFVEAEETREITIQEATVRAAPAKSSPAKPRPRRQRPAGKPRRRAPATMNEIDAAALNRAGGTSRTPPEPTESRRTGKIVAWVLGLALFATAAGLFTSSFYASDDKTEPTPSENNVVQKPLTE